MTNRPRPLSPHLQIYRWSVLMASSILHRASGLALCAGFILFVTWLWAIASGSKNYLAYTDFLASAPGQGLLFLISWALLHHLAGGMRHFIWDFGYNFDPAKARMMALLLGAIAFLANLLVWALAYGLV